MPVPPLSLFGSAQFTAANVVRILHLLPHGAQALSVRAGWARFWYLIW